MTMKSCQQLIDDQTKTNYQRDGAAVIRQVIDPFWVEAMRDAIEEVLNAPGPASIEYTQKDKRGRYYGDFFLWRRHPMFHRFLRDSPLPQLAAELMDATAVRFFYDQLLVKEPNTAEPTPWHQDLSYWPVRGEQVMSVWVPFDTADLASGVVQYIQGSHRWGKMYAPASFSKDSGFAEMYKKMNLQPLPDIEAERDQHTILHWEMEPGDVLIHHPLTLHYASGNASATGRRRGLALRYLGDDAVYDDRPGTFIHNPKVRELLPPVELQDGDAMEHEIFPQVWPSEANAASC